MAGADVAIAPQLQQFGPGALLGIRIICRDSEISACLSSNLSIAHFTDQQCICTRPLSPTELRRTGISFDQRTLFIIALPLMRWSMSASTTQFLQIISYDLCTNIKINPNLMHVQYPVKKYDDHFPGLASSPLSTPAPDSWLNQRGDPLFRKLL